MTRLMGFLVPGLMLVFGPVKALAAGCEPLETTAVIGETLDPKGVSLSEINQKYQIVSQWLETKRPDIPFVSVVIPAYKEEKRLPTSIDVIRQFLTRYPLPIEILVIVEKSPDRTVDVGLAAAAGHPQIQVIDNQVQRGKGYAVRSGMARAQGEITFFMDADLSTPLYEVIRFLDYMRTHPEADIVIGDRVKAIARDAGGRSPLRRMLTAGFKTIMHLASPLKFEDTQAGFKAFRRTARDVVFANQELNGFAFDVEVLILAQQLGLITHAVDINWLDDRRSTVRPLVDPVKMLVDILKIQTSVQKRLSLAKQR